MTDEELIARLRGKRERCHDLSGVYYTEDMNCQAAADRIEALVKERDDAHALLFKIESTLAKISGFFFDTFPRKEILAIKKGELK